MSLIKKVFAYVLRVLKALISAVAQVIALFVFVSVVSFILSLVLIVAFVGGVIATMFKALDEAGI